MGVPVTTARTVAGSPAYTADARPAYAGGGSAAVPVANLAAKLANLGRLRAPVTGLLNGTTLETVSFMGWCKFNAPESGDYTNIFEFWQADQSYTYQQYLQLFGGTSAAVGTERYKQSIDQGGGVSNHGNNRPNADTWFHWAVVRSWTGSIWHYRQYYNGVLDLDYDAPPGWVVTNVDEINIGYDGPLGGGANSANISVRDVLIAKREYTAAEILAQLASTTAVSSTNLYRFWPLNGASDLADSVAGALFTASGTVTDDATGPHP